jgi:hypothetical protein
MHDKLQDGSIGFFIVINDFKVKAFGIEVDHYLPSMNITAL